MLPCGVASLDNLKGEGTMKRIASEDLDDCVFIGEDGSVLEPGMDSFVLMPDPKARRAGGPCRLWLVQEGSFGYCPAELEMGGFDEAESACGAFSLGMGRSPEEADELILASMGGGTA